MSLRHKFTNPLLLLAVVFAGVLLTPTSAWAGFQPVLPEELKMTSEPLAPGAPAIILYRQVDRDDNGRTTHEDHYYRVKILTDEGRKYADLEIPFWKESQEVVNLHARTVRPDGSIAEFEGKIFEKHIVKARGVRFLAKTLALPDVQVGSILEYYFTVDLKHIYDSHWILSQELFTKRAQFSLKPYKSSYVPVGLRWTWQMLPTGVQPKEGPDHIIRMEATNIPAFQVEDFMPPVNELQSRVDFIYEEGFSPRDPDVFWKQLGHKWNDSLEHFVGKRKAMEEAVTQIVAPNDPADVKLRKIYDRVQKIRNTSYEFQKTQQEEKRDKEKPAENVKKSGNVDMALAYNSPGCIWGWCGPQASKLMDVGFPAANSIFLIPTQCKAVS